MKRLSEVHRVKFLTLPGSDKSLARPGRKQAPKHVRDTRDFNNIETRAVIKFFFARQDAEGNSRHSDRNISLFPSWSGQGLISTPVLGRCPFWVSIRTPTAYLISSSFFYVLPGEMQGNALDFVTTTSSHILYGLRFTAIRRYII